VHSPYTLKSSIVTQTLSVHSLLHGTGMPHQTMALMPNAQTPLSCFSRLRCTRLLWQVQAATLPALSSSSLPTVASLPMLPFTRAAATPRQLHSARGTTILHYTRGVDNTWANTGHGRRLARGKMPRRRKRSGLLNTRTSGRLHWRWFCLPHVSGRSCRAGRLVLRLAGAMLISRL